MKAVILDGSHENDLTGQHVRTTLTAELEARGWEIEHMQLCETKIGNCAGDFFCWIRKPGTLQRQRRQPPHRRLDCQLPTVGLSHTDHLWRIFIVTQENGGSSNPKCLTILSTGQWRDTSSEALSCLSRLPGNRLDGSARRSDRIHIPPSDLSQLHQLLRQEICYWSSFSESE